MDTLRNKTQGFTIVENKILKDTHMNMRDRGLYATLCSLPDGWELSVRGLAAILPDGKATITSSLNSLEEAGYLIRHCRKVRGRITGTEWEITVPEYTGEKTATVSGNVLFINRTQEGITVVKNNVIRNRNLSLKERGLLVTLLGLPTGWRMSIQGLAAMLPDGRYAVGQSLKKIEEQGYLKRRQLREENGTWTGSIWEVFDEPKTPEDPDGAVKKKEEKRQEKKSNDRKNQRISGVKPDKEIQCADNPDREILRTDKPDKEKMKPDDSS